LKLLVESRDGGRRPLLLAAAITFAVLAVLAIAARAQATETIYWDNYDANGLASADITGSGGGEVPLTGVKLNSPEGLAFDPSSGRIYVANFEEDQIAWANIDGSGGGVLTVPGMTVDEPCGVAVDPATRTIYWANESLGSIGWARLDGSAAGVLNTTGATIEEPCRPAIDTANKRLYWFNYGTEAFASADLAGGGGGADLALSGGAPTPGTSHGLDIDPAAGRLYWLDSSLKKVLWANVSGVGGGEVDITGSTFNGPYGLAFDPSSARFFWGNYGNGKERTGAIGTAGLTPGGIGGISPVAAPVEGIQDPIVLKSPAGTAAPAVTQNVAALSCSQGSWSPDYPGSFVYGAPTSYSYQWLLNGQAVPGATSSSLTATAAGSYSCAVTGKNLSGSASQTSAATSTVTAATLGVALKSTKAQAKAGKTVSVKFAISNAGDLSSVPIQVCAAKLTKRAKKGLVAPKCAAVAPLGHAGATVATLKVKTKKTAKGTYKFTTQVKGATVKPVTVSVKVIGAKKKHKKRH
jgi:DNA-binding beta-propeller fold protein YncE